MAMSEAKPWLEEDAPLEIELLIRAARAEKPSEASLQRSLSAVGIATLGAAAGTGAGGTAASLGSPATSLSPLTAGMVAKWATLGAALGTLAVGTATVAPRVWEEVQSGPPASQPLGPPGATATSAARLAPAAPAADPHPTLSVAPNPLAPSARAPRVVPAAPSVSAADETLIEEVRSVDRARAALAAGRPGDALARLDEYERDFVEHRFAPEALYLRMEALVSLGRTEQARTVAETLLARHPNSPHGARARVVLSKDP
jgi:hypothetical protein